MYPNLSNGLFTELGVINIYTIFERPIKGTCLTHWIILDCLLNLFKNLMLYNILYHMFSTRSLLLCRSNFTFMASKIVGHLDYEALHPHQPVSSKLILWFIWFAHDLHCCTRKRHQSGECPGWANEYSEMIKQFRRFETYLV